jgi:hypothetical protein
LRGRYEEVRSKAAGLVVIGMGWPAAAADFRERERIPFPLIVDHTKETYRTLGMKRGRWLDIMGPRRGCRGAVPKASWWKQAGQSPAGPAQLGGAVAF